MARLSIRSSVLALLIAALAACGAHAGSITTNDPPVATLADGRTGTIGFEALTPKSSRELVSGKATEKSVIAGVLTLPAPANAAGASNARIPAMVVVHGSSGVVQNDWDWAKRLNDLGVATFVIDNFTGRGVKETATDQSRLSPAADVAGALAALRLLATHPSIDPSRIGVIGFSRGGSAAINSALEPIRHAIINDDLRFAAHVARYPGCAVPFVSAHLDGSPMLMLLGGKDDYTPASFCLAYAEKLRAKALQCERWSIPTLITPSTRKGRRISIRGRRRCTIAMARLIWTKGSSRFRREIKRFRAQPPRPRSSIALNAASQSEATRRRARRRQATSPISSSRYSRLPISATLDEVSRF